MSVRRVAIVFVLLTWAAGLALAGPLQDDLKARRGRLLDQLTPQSLAVLWSAPTRVYSLDVDYEYRQDSNLLYLTGLNQPGTTLVLMPGNKTQREILFVSEPDPRREHREGHILTKEEATAASGIAAVYYAGQLEPFLAAMFGRTSFGDPKFADTREYETFFSGVAAGRANLALPLGPPPQPSAPLGAAYEFANKARERYLGVAVTDTWPILSNLRQVKTPYELTVLDQSAAISSDAHLAGMRATRPGRYEYEVEAEIERTYLSRGAMSWGYPSIVGSGPNATILHYEASSRQMQDGDLLLVDAAANFQGLTVDITRTYPVNGRFTEAQKDIYRVVLAAQEAGVRAAQAGNKTADITKAAAEVAKAGLLKLGLITDASGEQYRTWYTHGIIHWIGMDVHDVGDYDRALAPGMTFVIEPGLYIRPQALDVLPDTPENRAFKAAVAPAVAKYRNIGVRVEDSFAITATGLKNLSAKVPKSIEDVERTLTQCLSLEHLRCSSVAP
jgi:Xaa-Pro aminopeptidase